ncbi:MAG: hypothetical protein M1830_004906, partial [Pleopsidium flavum]
MAAPQPKNTFPKFDDADVEIRLSAGEQDVYRLHSLVLALHLPFFKASLSGRWTGGEEPRTSEGKLKWKYELIFKGYADGILVRKGNMQPSKDTAAEISEYQDGMLIDVTSKNPALVVEARRAIIYAHEQLFRLIYHSPSTISTDNFAVARKPIEDLYAIADMYGCAAMVAIHMEKHIQCFKSDVHLLRSFEGETPSVLDFAIKTRTGWIFREAIVRLIGCRQRLDPATRKACEVLGLKPLIEAKEAEFKYLLQRTEHQLLTSFGYGLRSFPDIGPASVLVRDFFREWFISRIRNGQGSRLMPGYAEVYRRLELAEIPSLRERDMFLSRYGQLEYHVSPYVFEQALREAFGQTKSVLAAIMTSRAPTLRESEPMKTPLTCI